MKRKRVVNPASPLPKINNLGGNSQAEAGVGVVVEVDLVLHTTPSLPVVQNHINDNQHLLSPPVVLSSSLGDLNLVSSANKETFQETVNLHVVPPAPSVKGLLQKKNVRPSRSQIEIKSVNSALSVNQCLFAPNVTNAPCVAKDPPVLAGLALPGFKSKGSLYPQGRVSTTLQGETTSGKISCDNQWFIKSLSKQKSERGIAFPRSKTDYRKGVRSVISGFLQPVVPGAKTQREMEAHSRSKPTEPLPCPSNVQDGNSGDHQTLPATGGVGHFAGFQRRLFSHSHKPQVAKISTVPLKRSDLSVHSTSLWPVDGSVGVHKGGQGGKTHGSIEGYSNPPIPRRLVTESPMPGNLPTSYPDPFGPLPLARLGSQHGQVRAGSPTNLRLRRLSFRPISGVSQTNSGQVEESISEAQPSPGTGMLHSQAVHVFNRPSDSNRKTSSVGAAAYEAHSVAPKKALACPGIAGKGHPNSFISPCTSKVVVGPGQGALRSTLTPSSTRPSTVYRRLKRRLGRSLRRLHGKRSLVRVRKRLAHKFVGAQGGPAGLKTVRAVMLQPDSSVVSVVSYINKEGGMKSGSLCALLWRLMLWCNQRQIVLRARHIPGHLNVIADKLSRLNQVIQTEWSLLPEVFAQICRRWHRPSVDLFATRFNHKLPRFVSPVPDQSAWGVDALSLPWEDLDAYAFPPTALLHQVVTKLLDHGFRRLILIAPGWPNMPWFWDLVNMSAQVPLLLPQVSKLITQPFNQCPHRDLPNLNLHAWLLEPLSSSRPGSRQKWQQELRLLKDALPEPFMNQSGPFLSDGVKRIRWTSELPL